MGEKSLKKNAFYSVLKVFLSLVFPLITFPYASRILLPEGIGKVNFANSIVSYFILIASLGIGGYATREASKVRDDRKELSKLFQEIITINMICCVVSYILFFIALYTVPKFSSYHDLLLVISVKIIFSVLGIEWIFSANEDFKYITIRTFIIQLLSLIYLFVFVKTKDDILHYAIFGILTAVGCNILNFLFVKKFISFNIHQKLDLKKHLKPIFVFFGITVVTSIYTMLDTTMLGFLSSDTEVGLYTASTKLGHMVLSMLTAITAVLLPRLTKIIKNNDSGSFNELVAKSANILLLLSFPMTAGVMVLCKPLITLLSGEQYLSAIPSMIIISPIIISISFGSLTGVQILPALGKEKISLYSYIIGAVTNLILNSILIPRIGAAGAATGTLCAEFIVTFIQVIYLRKIIFNKDLLKNISQVLIATCFMVLILKLLMLFINNIFIQLLLCTGIGIIIYAGILLLFRNKYFIFYTKKILGR